MLIIELDYDDKSQCIYVNGKKISCVNFAQLSFFESYVRDLESDRDYDAIVYDGKKARFYFNTADKSSVVYDVTISLDSNGNEETLCIKNPETKDVLCNHYFDVSEPYITPSDVLNILKSAGVSYDLNLEH